jgi:D-amino peptidase
VKRSREKTATAVLKHFLGATRGTSDWQRALRALTLFMVKGHAPRFFARHKLQKRFAAAVKALGAVPRRLPSGLPAVDAMSRLDAAWVEWATGTPPRLPSLDETRAFLDATLRREGALWAWVMSVLAGQMGIDCRLEVPRATAKLMSEEEHLYFLTHQVLFWTNYLSQPLPNKGPWPDAQKLVEGARLALAVKQLDLLAEIAFCLQALELDFEPAMAFEAHVDESGQLGEDTGYSGAHEAAAALVALAGALERRRARRA